MYMGNKIPEKLKEAHLLFLDFENLKILKKRVGA